MKENNLIDKYDWIIMSRSDFIWDIPHFPSKMLKEVDSLYVPNAEMCLGHQDRHIIIPAKYIEQFDVLSIILFESKSLLSVIDTFYPAHFLTCEGFIFCLIKMRKFKSVYIPYTMYMVHEKDTPHWSRDVWIWIPAKKYFIRSHVEYSIASGYINLSKEAPNYDVFWERSLKLNLNVYNNTHQLYKEKTH